MPEVLDEEDAPSKPSSISVSIHRLPCPRRLRRRSSTRRSSENTVAEYMQSLEEKGDKRFKKQFATYLADGVGVRQHRGHLYLHTCRLREDPAFKPSDKLQDWKAERPIPLQTSHAHATQIKHLATKI
ncbi:hypothetical protein C8R47DRAFT_1212797 [Mycena vitilis]|nr:hypothetical protein C8R47DRAFT_1212797 [Mycena vitilis]